MSQLTNLQKTLNKIKRMAKEYQVSKNALFISTLDTYMIQKDAIEKIQQSLEADGPTVEKEYVKGRVNLYMHPALKELPRHTDAINKTTAQLISIIKNLGSKPQISDELMDFITQ